jgi:hypothetical protein
MEKALGRPATALILFSAAALLLLAGISQASAPVAKQVAQIRAERPEDLGRTAAQPGRIPEQSPAAVASEDDEPVIYVPPRRGAPRARVGGGLRGAPALPVPLALAPDHLAQTISARPSLFWHIDGVPPRGTQLVFTLIDETGIDPLAEVELPRPAGPGIQRIDLARLGIRIETGVEYQWSVALIADPGRRADDMVSFGYLRRVAAPRDLARKSTSASSYAARGFWYDALASISDAIETAPGDRGLRLQRNALLRQVQLDAAAE